MRKIKRGEIYYANLCPVIGSEQGGVRPVIILQNNTGNHYSPTTIVAAITSRETKTQMPTHVKVTTPELHRESIVLLEQIRTIDKTRLLEYVGTFGRTNMKQIEQALVVSLGLDHCMEGERGAL